MLNQMMLRMMNSLLKLETRFQEEQNEECSRESRMFSSSFLSWVFVRHVHRSDEVVVGEKVSSFSFASSCLTFLLFYFHQLLVRVKMSSFV